MAACLALPFSAQGGDQLYVPAGPIDPVTESSKANTLSSSYGIIQFSEKSGMSAKAIQALGAEVVAYLPESAYIVRLGNSSLSELQALGGVAYAGPWRAAYVVSERAKSVVAKSTATDLVVSVFKGESLARIEQAIAKVAPAATVIRTHSDQLPQLIVRVPSDPVLLTAISNVDGVMAISHRTALRFLNRDSVGVVQANIDTTSPSPEHTPIWDQDIIGTGQIVGVADGGLDRNENWFRHYDDGSGVVSDITPAHYPVPPETGRLFLDRKVVAYWVMPGADPYDTNAACNGVAAGFHGTHVTGSVAGDAFTTSTPTEPNYDAGDGMAPNAQILFQDIGADDPSCLDGDADTPMFQQAFDAGVRVHSNSYGGTAVEQYTPREARLDGLQWALEDLMILFAAGNDGPGASTVGPPAGAKNVVSVGASFHGDITTIMGFSSRGPAHDGRIKPDVVAPGATIISAAGNDTNGQTQPPFLSGNDTTSKSGTSMATPTVAGASALLRQYFDDGFYPTGTRQADDEMNPTGALMKATLLNGTNSYSDAPATDSGWGRVWLDNNLYFSGDDRAIRVWDKRHKFGVKTGDNDTYTVQVNPGEEFRATLVWLDPAGIPGPGPALVNDLDLQVTLAGNTYKGNRFRNGESATGGSFDVLNPVEQVLLTAPDSGEATITVSGSSVPGNGEAFSDRQGYALVVSSAQCDTAVSGTADISLSTDVTGTTIDIAAASGASHHEVYRADGQCGDVGPEDFTFVGKTSNSQFLDQFTIGQVNYAYQVRGADSCGVGAYSECMDIFSESACNLPPVFDSRAVTLTNTDSDDCGVTISWDSGESSCPATDLSYSIYRSTEADFVPGPESLVISGLTETEYVDLGVDSLVEYHYVVRATDTANQGIGEPNSSSNETRHAITSFALVDGTFQDDAEGLQLVTTEAPWTRVTDVASNGTASYRNTANAEYADDTCAALTTPPLRMSVAGNGVLSYNARYDLEPSWDGVIVEVSTDDGATWSDLPPVGGYPGTLALTEPNGIPVNECGYPATQGAFTGTNNGAFDGFSHDLDAFAGETILIRWNFTSDPATTATGFWIDEIEITSSQTAGECTMVDLGIPLTADHAGAWSLGQSTGGPGSGISMQVANLNGEDQLTAVVFDFDDGVPYWGIGVVPLNGATSLQFPITRFSGTDFPPNFVSADVVAEPLGTATLTLTDDSNGMFEIDSTHPDFPDLSEPITQLLPLAAPTGEASCLSGAYVFNSLPSGQPGHGLLAEVFDLDGGVQGLAMTWFNFLAGQQVFVSAVGLVSSPLAGPIEADAFWFQGSDGDPNVIVAQPFGTMSFEPIDPNSANFTWTSDDPMFSSGNATLDRVTYVSGWNCP